MSVAVAVVAAAAIAVGAVAAVAVEQLDVVGFGLAVATVVDDADLLNADGEVSVDPVWLLLPATRRHLHAYPKHLDGAPT